MRSSLFLAGVCALLCLSGAAAQQPQTCTSNAQCSGDLSACLVPAGLNIGACVAAGTIGTSCTEASQCTSLGGVQPQCLNGRCTLPGGALDFKTCQCLCSGRPSAGGEGLPPVNLQTTCTQCTATCQAFTPLCGPSGFVAGGSSTGGTVTQTCGDAPAGGGAGGGAGGNPPPPPPPSGTTTGGSRPTATGGAGPAPAPGSGSGGAACTFPTDCKSGEFCKQDTKTCAPIVPPSLHCGTRCNAETEQCFAGLCIPKAQERACAQTCSAANGEVCNTLAGICEIPPGATPTCTPACAEGAVCKPTFPGLPPVCRRPVTTGPTTCSPTQACGAGAVCTRGQCVVCGSLCSSLTGAPDGTALAAALLNVGFGADANVTIRNSAAVGGLVNAQGRLDAGANALLQLDAAITTLRQLSFGAAGNAAAQVADGQRVALDSVDTTSAGAKMLLGAGASLAVRMLSVSATAALTLAMSATAENRAMCNCTELELQGPLNVVGDASSVLQFPTRPGRASASGNGNVQVSGGVNLQGDAGSVPINIGAAASPGAGAQAAVSPAQELRAAGDILGQQSAMAVRGALVYAGSLIQPALQLEDGGSVTFQTSAASKTVAGNLTIAQGSKLNIDGTSTTNGEQLYFGKLAACPAGSTITLKVAGSAKAALADKTVTLFNYGAETYALTSGFTCAIQVCGTDGGECVQVHNPNVAEGRRRLLDDHDHDHDHEGHSQAVWGAESATIAPEPEAKAGAKLGAASGVSASAGLVAMLLLAGAAMLRL